MHACMLLGLAKLKSGLRVTVLLNLVRRYCGQTPVYCSAAAVESECHWCGIDPAFLPRLKSIGWQVDPHPSYVYLLNLNIRPVQVGPGMIYIFVIYLF